MISQYPHVLDVVYQNIPRYQIGIVSSATLILAASVPGSAACQPYTLINTARHMPCIVGSSKTDRLCYVVGQRVTQVVSTVVNAVTARAGSTIPPTQRVAG